MANVEEVVIRIDVDSPDNEGGKYEAYCVEPVHMRGSSDQPEGAIAEVLGKLSRYYKGLQ